MGTVAVVVLAIGIGWYALREPDRSAERFAALAAGQEFRPDAGEKLSAYLSRDPNDAQILETLVVWSLHERVPFPELEPLLDRLCELKPTDPAPWRTRAVERIRAGRVAEGISDGLRSLELEPNDTDTLALVASSALDSGDPATATKVVSEWVKATPQPPDTLTTLLIRAHLQAGDVNQAALVQSKYFPESRTDPEADLQRALVLQATGDHEQAVNLLRSLGRAPKQRNAALAALAKSLTALGRDAEALLAFEELDTLQTRERAIVDATQRPDNLTAQVRAAEAHLADGKPADAARLLERARAKLGPSPESAAVLARAYRQLGREDLATKYEQEGR